MRAYGGGMCNMPAARVERRGRDPVAPPPGPCDTCSAFAFDLDERRCDDPCPARRTPRGAGAISNRSPMFGRSAAKGRPLGTAAYPASSAGTTCLAVLAWTAPLLLCVITFGHTVALRHLLTLVTLIAVCAHVAQRGLARPPNRNSLLAWLLVSLLACVWSVIPRQSLHEWLDEAFYPLVLFYAFYLLGVRDAGAARIQGAMLIGMLLLALLSLIGYAEITADTARHGVLYYYPGVGQASTLAVYAMPIFAALAANPGRTRALGAIGLLATLVAGAASLNRMFWPAAVATLAVLTIPWIRILGRRLVLLLAVALAVAAIGLAAISQVRGLVPSAAVGADLAQRAADQLESDPRPEIWRAWAVVVQEHPYIGVGFGKSIPAAYHLPRITADSVLRNEYNGTHAHNLFFNILLQTGAVGLIVYVWLLGALAWQFVRRRASNPHAAWTGIALIVAMLTKNATDDFMRDSVAMYFWALAGWLLARSQLDAEEPRRHPGSPVAADDASR